VIGWLRRSLQAVKQAHLKETPQQLARKLKIEGRDSTVDWIYLRIIIHSNEHMGQLVAYVRPHDRRRSALVGQDSLKPESSVFEKLAAHQLRLLGEECGTSGGKMRCGW
jgi:hypothetical protein